MATAFLSFGDRLIHTQPKTGHGDSGPAYCEVVKTFLYLTAQAHEEEGWPGDQLPDVIEGNDPPSLDLRTTQSVVQTPVAEVEPSPCSSYESVFAEPFPGSDGTSQHLEFLPPMSSDVQSLSPSIILMPTQNPLLAGDYLAMEVLSSPELSLWKRLLRHGMLRSYRALECADNEQAQPKSWLARSHHFSLRHATRWHLLFPHQAWVR